MNIVRAFFTPKSGHSFSILKKRDIPPLPLPSYASVIFCQFLKPSSFYKSEAKIETDKSFIMVSNFNLRLSCFTGFLVTNQASGLVLKVS